MANETSAARKSVWKPIIGTAGMLLGATALCSAATQYIASQAGYDPALGPPIVGHLYAPWAWLQWQQAPWASSLSSAFSAVESGMLAAMSLGMLGVFTASNASRRKPRKYDDAYGTARFATEKEIRDSGLMPGLSGVYVGAWTDRKGELRYLRHDGPEHIAAVAPTRSGKGVGLVLPTLLSWPASAVVFDEKGELWNLTAGWREQHAENVVFRWQPGSPDQSCKYNFLEEIRIGTPYEVADAQNVAIMICDPEGKGFKDHWDKTAYALITGLILHECYRAKARGEVASLPDVAYSLSDPSRTADALYQEMVNNRHLDGQRHSVVGAAGRDQLNREPKERTSVHSTATTYLELFRDPLIAGNTRTSDFRDADLMNHDKPVSLYILVPGSDKVRLRPLVRLMLTMIMRGLTGVDIRYDEGKPVLPHKHRLLLMLDEFPSLGRMTVIEDALAKCAGFGIKAYLVMQDREQLLAAYHVHETIMSNCHIRIAYAPNKIETAEWISKMLGTTTVVMDTYSESGKRSGFLSNVSHTYHQNSRPLITPDEVMRLRAPRKERDRIVEAGELVLFAAGMPPIRGSQILYFRDRIFAWRASVPPPSQAASIRQQLTYEVP
jgi:type IV secretion system protein VirD4